jgi:hypothetical protein
VYAIAWSDNVLKIGFCSNDPSQAIGVANQRHKRYTGSSAAGELIWHKVGATTADEALLQALFCKAFGVAFNPDHTRVSEWVHYPTLEIALESLDEWYELGNSISKQVNHANFPG